jgi:hypothetical protein
MDWNWFTVAMVTLPIGFIVWALYAFFYRVRIDYNVCVRIVEESFKPFELY